MSTFCNFFRYRSNNYTMLPKQFLERLLVLATFVYATNACIITGFKVDRSQVNLAVGDITVEANSYWSILGNSASSLNGALWVKKSAGFYIAGTDKIDSLSVTLPSGSHSINNEGTIVFNSISCKSTTKYQLSGTSFCNSGEMYLAGNGASGSLTSITSNSWTNSGLLSFHQKKRTNSCVSLGQPSGTIHNSGQICLHNHLFQQQGNIVGGGCLTANENSSIFLSNCNSNIDSTHSFYLADCKSSMRAKASSKSKTFNVYGFGGGNMIGLDLPLLSGVNGWCYNAVSGILTLKAKGNLSQNFSIGCGYDKNKFQITSDCSVGLSSVSNGALKYNGPCPKRKLPAVCKPCKPIPSCPQGTTTKTTTKSSSTGASTPNPQTTVTSTWTGFYTTVVTETATPGGTDTVIVEVPSSPNPQTTVTS
ncbi:HYR1-like protein, partial [Scheffersomyces stipitis CBS 6054]